MNFPPLVIKINYKIEPLQANRHLRRRVHIERNALKLDAADLAKVCAFSLLLTSSAGELTRLSYLYVCEVECYVANWLGHMLIEVDWGDVNNHPFELGVDNGHDVVEKLTDSCARNGRAHSRRRIAGEHTNNEKTLMIPYVPKKY